jgi:hypothetical protein
MTSRSPIVVLVAVMLSSGCDLVKEAFTGGQPSPSPSPTSYEWKICQRRGMSGGVCSIRAFGAFCNDAPTLLGTYQTKVDAEQALNAFRNQIGSDGLPVCN